MKLPFLKKKYKPDLSNWNFNLADMWDIVGVNNKRCNELIKEIEKIIEMNNKQMVFVDLCKEVLTTLPQNHTEYIWLVFYMGERFMILNFEKDVREHNAKYHNNLNIPNLEFDPKKAKRAD